MKIINLSLILIFCFFSAQLIFGQDKPQAILLDEFPKTGSEEFAARIDALINDLANDQTSQGYFVIYPGREAERSDFKSERWYEIFTKELISMRKFNKTRIKIVRSESEDAIKFQLWKLQPGAEVPFPIKEKWIVPPLDLSKPFVFGYNGYDDIFPHFIPEFYADYLKSNENLRGHIVIFHESRKQAKEMAAEWIKILTEEYNVPRNRLKVFFGKPNGSVINPKYVSVPVESEFWLVPNRTPQKLLGKL